MEGLNLTPIQLEVLAFIKTLTRTATREELATALGIQADSVSDLLKRLKAKGCVATFKSGKHIRIGLTLAGRKAAEEWFAGSFSM